MPVGGRGQEVSADWKCPTDGFQVTTMRRVLKRGASESLRRVAGRRGWERCDMWQEQPRQNRAGDSSPARGELRASSDASSSLNGAKVKVVGLRRPSGQQGFVAKSLDCRQRAFAKAEAFCFFARSVFGRLGGVTSCRRGGSILLARINEIYPNCWRLAPEVALHRCDMPPVNSFRSLSPLSPALYVRS